LVVADKRLLTFYPEEQNDPLVNISLDEIENIETRKYVGNSGLLVRSNGRNIEVLRFTSIVRPKIESLIRKLESYSLGLQSAIVRGNSHAVGMFQEEQRRCPKCGRVIPPWLSNCPVCMSKRKVISRLLGYNRPHIRLAAAGFTCCRRI